MITTRMMQWAADARPVPHDRSSTRSTPRTSTCPALLAAIQRRLRQGMPADQPAGRRRHGASSTASSTRRASADFSSVAEAHQALDRPGGRGRRGADGEVPREGRGRRRSSCTRRSSRRCAKATSSRSASCRRATAPACAELLDVFVQLLPNPAEGNPPLFYKGEGASRRRVPLRARSRRSTCSRTCSRS